MTIYFSKDYGLDILIKSIIMVLLMIIVVYFANSLDTWMNKNKDVIDEVLKDLQKKDNPDVFNINTLKWKH